MPDMYRAATADGVSGTATFDPTAISGLKLWLAARKETGYADADAVGTATDFSTAGIGNATGATTARPTYKTNVINSQAAFLFDGAANVLTTAATAVGQDHDAGATVFAVIRTGGSLASSQVVGKCNAGGTQFEWELAMFETNHHPNFYLFTDAGASAQIVAGADITNAINTVYILGARITVGTSQGIQTNGGTEQTSSTVSDVPTARTNPLSIGARGDGGQWFIGHIAEVLIWDSRLSDANMLSTTNSLKTLYGVS